MSLCNWLVKWKRWPVSDRLGTLCLANFRAKQRRRLCNNCLSTCRNYTWPPQQLVSCPSRLAEIPVCSRIVPLWRSLADSPVAPDWSDNANTTKNVKITTSANSPKTNWICHKQNDMLIQYQLNPVWHTNLAFCQVKTRDKLWRRFAAVRGTTHCLHYRLIPWRWWRNWN